VGPELGLEVVHCLRLEFAPNKTVLPFQRIPWYQRILVYHRPAARTQSAQSAANRQPVRVCPVLSAVRPIVVRSVRSIRNVPQTSRVWTKSVATLAPGLVDIMLNVMSWITLPCAPVFLDILEIRSAGVCCSKVSFLHVLWIFWHV